ncbi:MAG: DUF2254 family protein, partial [Vulcanimicrobiaceae bacterium]
HMHPVTAQRDGYIGRIDAVVLGNVAREWSAAAPTAGIRLCVRTGEHVERGQVLAECYGAHTQAARVQEAFAIGDARPTPHPLVYATI